MTTSSIIATDKLDIPSTIPDIKIGLSACLAGQNVRYNGGHTQSRLCQGKLSDYFKFETFCPEVAAGFGTPRPTMRLIGSVDEPKLVFSNDDSVDLTQQLMDGFEAKLDDFAALDGYILMKNSPSCGLQRVKVYQENGYPHQDQRSGLFAAALKEKYPLMPIEEEGRLHDALLYDNFIIRVYAHSSMRHEVLAEPSIHKLIGYHSRYKYLIMAHNQALYKKMGQRLANSKGQPIDELVQGYFELLMKALSKPASRKNHTNALLHMLGYLKESVPAKARQDITDIIHKYRDGVFPLGTPLTLLKHYLNLYGSDYIKDQVYLEPYPETLSSISQSR